MDPGSAAIIAAGALVSKDTIGKLLGPSADYFGQGMKGYAEKAKQNVDRIFANATRTLGDALEQPGGVHPKVLRTIIQEGAFCEDPLASEYFGGVLASSRTGVPRDDRCDYYARLVAQLSIYQLRAHYICYQTVRSRYVGQSWSIGDGSGDARMQTILLVDELYGAMAFEADEDRESLMDHVVLGLCATQLIGHYYRWSGDVESERTSSVVRGPGFEYLPSPRGVELFMAAYGYADQPLDRFLDPTLTFEPKQDVLIPKEPASPP